MTTEELDVLGYEFFREFARYEYCLKAIGLRVTGRYGDAKPDWSKYAAETEVARVIESPAMQELAAATQYFMDHPPKKQVIKNGVLDWADALPENISKAELVLLLIRRVRNNHVPWR